jgi:hypothetical protein
LHHAQIRASTYGISPNDNFLPLPLQGEEAMANLDMRSIDDG